MDFCREESCGKCIPCRVGTAQLHTPARRRSATARPPLADLDQLEELCDMVQRHQPVRPRPDRAEPGLQHAALLPRRVPGPHRSDRSLPGRASARSPTAAEALHMSVHTLHDRRHRRRRRREGQTILEVARENGIDIPTLCHLDGLSATSAPAGCAWSRSAGSGKLLPACVTAVEEGMEVDRPLRAAAPSTGARSSRCCSPSATTSARSAWPTATASSRTWPQTLGLDHVRAARTVNPQRRRRRQPRAVRASTTTAASCAPAACGSATRSKAPTPGT